MSWRRSTILLSLLVVLAPALVGAQFAAGPAYAARPSATPTWQLIDYQQKACYVSIRGGISYYGIWISGSWTHQLDIGATGLPAGGSYTNSYAPIAPGSSDGVGSLAYVDVTLPVGTTPGTYTAAIWASDATTTESVPITLVVNATSCRHY